MKRGTMKQALTVLSVSILVSGLTLGVAQFASNQKPSTPTQNVRAGAAGSPTPQAIPTPQNVASSPAFFDCMQRKGATVTHADGGYTLSLPASADHAALRDMRVACWNELGVRADAATTPSP